MEVFWDQRAKAQGEVTTSSTSKDMCRNEAPKAKWLKSPMRFIGTKI